MKNYSFKQFVENKDLNEVGQHVFPDKEGEFPERDKIRNPSNKGYLSPEKDLKQIGMDAYGSDMFAFGSAVEKSGKWYDKNNKLGLEGTPIFEITYFGDKNGIYVHFTNEMKSQLAYNLSNHKNSRSGDMNDLKNATLKSMINLAGAIITKHSQQHMEYGIPEQIVSFEPIFDFLSDEKELKNFSKYQNQDIKISLPITLFDKGLKLVALEVENKINSIMKSSFSKNEPRSQRALDRVIRKFGPNIIITSNTGSMGNKIDPSRQTLKPSNDKHSLLMDKEREETKERRKQHRAFTSVPSGTEMYGEKPRPNEMYPWKTHEYLANVYELKKKAEAARDNNVPFDYSNQGLKSSYDFLLQDLKTLRNEGPKAFLQTTGPDTTGRHRTKNDAYSDMKKLIDSLEEKQKKMSRPEPIPELKSKSEPMSSMPEQKPKRSWRDYLAGK